MDLKMHLSNLTMWKHFKKIEPIGVMLLETSTSLRKFTITM